MAIHSSILAWRNPWSLMGSSLGVHRVEHDWANEHAHIFSCGFPGGLAVKNLPISVGDPDMIPGQQDPMEKEMATLSSILAWEISWTEEPGRLQHQSLPAFHRWMWKESEGLLRGRVYGPGLQVTCRSVAAAYRADWEVWSHWELRRKAGIIC